MGIEQDIKDEIDKVLKELADDDLDIRIKAERQLIRCGFLLAGLPLIGLGLFNWFMRYIGQSCREMTNPEAKARCAQAVNCISAAGLRQKVKKKKKELEAMKEARRRRIDDGDSPGELQREIGRTEDEINKLEERIKRLCP